MIPVLFASLANAGPVATFTGSVASPPIPRTAVAFAPTPRTSAVTPVVVAVVAVVDPRAATTPSGIAPSPMTWTPTPQPLLRSVPAEPHKRRVENPGTLIPIDQIPSAFQPLPPPMTEVRPRSIEESR